MSIPIIAYLDEFKELCKVPHASFNPEKIIPFLVNKIKSYGITDVVVDKSNNIFYRICASRGHEKKSSILLQAHTDMVGVKKDEYQHDFKSDPIKIFINKKRVMSANNTSLGADNGIGVAYILAITKFQNKFKHPAIEVLLTWNEEVAPQGILGFNMNLIKSRMVINLDNEEMNSVVVGCAGVRFSAYKLTNLSFEQINNAYTYQFKISGLQGGHSGAYIGNLRTNAITLLALLVKNIFLDKKINFSIINFESINPLNVIPNSCIITLAFAKKLDLKKTNLEIKNFLKQILQFFTEEDQIKCDIVEIKNQNRLYGLSNSRDCILSLTSLPEPVLYYDEKNFMYYISYNLATIKLAKNINCELCISLRSTNDFTFDYARAKIDTALSRFTQFKCEYSNASVT
jgi:dipeptidase D